MASIPRKGDADDGLAKLNRTALSHKGRSAPYSIIR